MNEDQIIARAQRDVAARRGAAAERRWSGAWRWLPPSIGLAVLLAFFVAPVPLPRKLLLMMGGVCSLRPAHSYFAGGIQLPLESRMTGIYGGFLLTLALLLAFRRVGARWLARKLVAGLLVIMFTSMVFDGINSTLAEIGLPHLYTPTNALRLVTGLLSGIALAPLLVWLIGLVAVPHEGRGQRVVIQSPGELLVPLAINAGFAAVVMSGNAASFLPIALVSVAGIVTVLAGAGLLVVLVISGLEGRVTRLRQLVAPGAIALLVALAVLAGTAAFRWSVTGSGEPPAMKSGERTDRMGKTAHASRTETSVRSIRKDCRVCGSSSPRWLMHPGTVHVADRMTDPPFGLVQQRYLAHVAMTVLDYDTGTDRMSSCVARLRICMMKPSRFRGPRSATLGTALSMPSEEMLGQFMWRHVGIWLRGFARWNKLYFRRW